MVLKFEIDQGYVQVQQLLDTDAFGAIHLGVLTNILGFRQRVILRTARDNTPEQRKLLQAELDLMANIGHHENVLHIFGSKSIGSNERLCVITEYCEQGRLAHFLSEKHKLDLFIDEIVLSNLQKGAISSNCLRTKFFAQEQPSWSPIYQARRDLGFLTTSDLLSFAMQIASGIEFLASKRVLHQNISLREILLKNDFTIKIANGDMDCKANGHILDANCRQKSFGKVSQKISMEGVKIQLAPLWTFAIILWELFSQAQNIGRTENMSNLVSNAPKFAPIEIDEMIQEVLKNEWKQISHQSAEQNIAECRKMLQQLLTASCLHLANELKERSERSETMHLHVQRALVVVNII